MDCKNTYVTARTKDTFLQNSVDVFYSALYNALNMKSDNKKIDVSNLIANESKFENLNYEIYYFLYLATDDSKYLKISHKMIMEIDSTENPAFFKLPIPVKIIDKMGS